MDKTDYALVERLKAEVTAGAPAAMLKALRGNVLTAASPRETQRRLADAFGALSSGASDWRAAA